MSAKSIELFDRHLESQGKPRLVVAGRLTRRDAPTTPPPAGEGIAMKQRAHRLRLIAAQLIREARELEDAAEAQL